MVYVLQVNVQTFLAVAAAPLPVIDHQILCNMSIMWMLLEGGGWQLILVNFFLCFSKISDIFPYRKVLNHCIREGGNKHMFGILLNK